MTHIVHDLAPVISQTKSPLFFLILPVGLRYFSETWRKSTGLLHWWILLPGTPCPWEQFPPSPPSSLRFNVTPSARPSLNILFNLTFFLPLLDPLPRFIFLFYTCHLIKHTGIPQRYCRFDSRPPQWSEYGNKVSQGIFWFPNACKSYVYSIL